MIFQQFGGINGIGFYASETFESAGNSGFLNTSFLMFFVTSLFLETSL
jgi:hypothetical protein